MNKLHKLLMLLVAPLFALVVCSSCSDDEDTVYIYTIEDLQDLQDRVNDGNYALNGVLMADIDMSGLEWYPIGYSSWYPYCGTFNGNGFTISNLTITSAASHRGLFGVGYEADFKNVKIKNPQVSGGVYVGALCGYLVDECSVTNCSVEGGSIEGYNSVGGLVGEAYYTDFKDCWSSATVTSTSQHVGGVVGIASVASFDNCYNTGDVNGSGSYIGGLIGSASDSEISGCYNTGDVTGATSSDHVGGIVGNSIRYISACYNTGAISGNNYVGGIAGSSMAVYTTYMDMPAIIACYNSGAISGTQYFAGVAGRVLSTTLIDLCYSVDESAAQVGVWIDNGSGTYTSSDEGIELLTSISELNSKVTTINTQIEEYILSTSDVDIAYRYSAGEPSATTPPTLYKY